MAAVAVLSVVLVVRRNSLFQRSILVLTMTRVQNKIAKNCKSLNKTSVESEQ
jgi:hypothetical protein